MADEPYLQRLTARLIDGMDRIPAEIRDRHRTWLLEQQNPDGGFSGREGGSDLYYTGFALRSLAVLEGLSPTVCERSARFLSAKMLGSAGVVDLFSLLVGMFLTRLGGGPDLTADCPPDWPDRTLAILEQHRTPDGGYAKALGGRSGSTYTTFLVALTVEMLGRILPERDRIVTFLRDRLRDGGYVEIPQMKRAGTNPTAAGIGVLRMLGSLDSESAAATTEFLLPLRSDFEGGFRANDRIPAADLLSSFTAAWTLAELNALDRIDRVELREYAESMEIPTGGFKGGLWDDGYDVEYTFYGLGVLSLLSDTY